MAEDIEREALLNSICKKYCNCDYDGECPNCRLTEPIVAAPAASVPQWISVKDRPPEDNDRVIAFRPYEAEVSAYRYSVMWGWALKTSVSHSGITHWMPLPEPPKGENDG